MLSLATLLCFASVGQQAVADPQYPSYGEPNPPDWPNGPYNKQCPSSGNPSAQSLSTEWSGWGGNIYNNHWASDVSTVTSFNAGVLNNKCRIPCLQGVSTTPTIQGDYAYYPTWNGSLFAVNYKTCVVKWELDVAQICANFAPLDEAQLIAVSNASRTSPQIEDDVLYIGTEAHALLIAVDVSSGVVLGQIQINPHPLAVLTMSPTVYKGRIFIGASSGEETAALFVPHYQCCSFVGNFAAVDFNRVTKEFTIVWSVNVIPENEGWSGGGLWGSQPSIDIARSQVFIGTGNVYTIPPAYEACQNETANISVIAEGLVPSTCQPSNVYQESVIAFDIDTGFMNWVRKLSPLDAWTLACGLGGAGLPRNPVLCPYAPGPDADFGMAPTFVPASNDTPRGLDTVVVGQKNGNLYALSAQAGTPLWSTTTGPGGTVGGLTWGIAVDSSRVYFAAVNSELMPFTLEPGNKTTTHGSAFGAVSLKDGSILWEVETPSTSANGSISLAPPTVVNDIVFFGRTGDVGPGGSYYLTTKGGLVAVQAADGTIIRDYDLDAEFQGGIAVQDGFVLFGSGYRLGVGEGSFHVWTV